MVGDSGSNPGKGWQTKSNKSNMFKITLVISDHGIVGTPMEGGTEPLIGFSQQGYTRILCPLYKDYYSGL